MNRRTQSIVLGFACLVAALVVGTQSGCGGNVRRTTIAAELAAVKTARQIFHEWDVEQQVRIASTAESREEGERQLQVFQKLRNNVTRAFAYVIQLLLDAAVAEDEQSLAKARKSAGELVKGISQLKPGQDPPPKLELPCGGFVATPTTECKEL